MTPEELERLERLADRAEGETVSKADLIREVIEILRPHLDGPSWIEAEEMGELTRIDPRWFYDHRDELGVHTWKVTRKIRRWDRAGFYSWMKRQEAA